MSSLRIDFDVLAQLGYDKQSAFLRFRDDDLFFSKCLEIYFQSDNITRLEKLTANREWSKALDCAHTLKGSTANLALETLSELYRNICAEIRKGAVEGVPEMVFKARELENAVRAAAGFMAVKSRK